MPIAITLQELFDYSQAETDKWEAWFRRNPAALDCKIDIAEAPDARTLVLHIFGAELIFAEMLHGRDAGEVEQLPASTIDELFAVHRRARTSFQAYLDSARDQDWAMPIALGSGRFGKLPGSKRKGIVQAMVHGIRHWAQLATALRTAGHKQDWNHDFLFTKAMD